MSEESLSHFPATLSDSKNAAGADISEHYLNGNHISSDDESVEDQDSEIVTVPRTELDSQDPDSPNQQQQQSNSAELRSTIAGTESEINLDHVNSNTEPVADNLEPETMILMQKASACKDNSSSSSFIKEIFRVPALFKIQTLEPEYHTFPLFKKTTRQIGTRTVDGDLKPHGSGASATGGSPADSTTRVPAPAQRTLEDYIKKQTAEYLDALHQQGQQQVGQPLEEQLSPQEATSGSAFPLMVQGLDANWPSPRQRPDLDVIYSIDKSTLTVLRKHDSKELEQEEREKSFAWEQEDRVEDEEHSRLLGTKSKAEVIATFVYPHDKEEEESGTKGGRLPRPQSSKAGAAVLTISKAGVAGTSTRNAYTDQKDVLINSLLEKINVVNQILMDTLIVNREALDIVTFPLSHDFESFGRIRGIFWVLSQTARTIKSLDKQQTDTSSIIGFALKEIDGFSALVAQFMVDSLLLVRELRVGLKKVKKLATVMEKELRKVFPLPPCNHTSALPIYSTDMDATCITFYEQFQGSNFFDHDKTSIELLWTPTMSYFKGFKEKDWYCFQVESSQLQVKILLALIKLAKKIFLEVKYVLEEEVDTIDTHFTSAGVEIQKTLKDLKTLMKASNASGRQQQQQQTPAQGSASGAPEVPPQVEELYQQLQITYDLFNTLDDFQQEFEAGFKWIRSVTGDMREMAALRPEDMDDFRERQNAKGSFFCPIFERCRQKTDPFLQSNFRFMLLRVPLQNDLIFKLLQGLKSKTPWNGNAQKILKIMSGAQVSQFREKRRQEDSIENANEGVFVAEGQETRTNVENEGSPTGKQEAQEQVKPIEYRKTPLTVYNVGHVYMEIKS